VSYEQGADLSHLIRLGPGTALLKIDPPFDAGLAKHVMAPAHTFLESHVTQESAQIFEGHIGGRASGQDLLHDSIVPGHDRRVLRERGERDTSKVVGWRSPSLVVFRVMRSRVPNARRCGFSTKQTARLLNAAEGTRMYAPVLVAVTAGMRRGELLGLRWADVDLDEAVCSVQQALGTTADGLAFREPKPGKSRRSIALTPVRLKARKRHLVQQRWDRRRVLSTTVTGAA
jgi:integrase